MSDTEFVYELKSEHGDKIEKKVVEINNLKSIIETDYLSWLSDNAFYWVKWGEVSTADLQKFSPVNLLIDESLYVNPLESELSLNTCFKNVSWGFCKKQSLPGTYFVATTTAVFAGYERGYVFRDKARDVLNKLGYVEIGGSDGLPTREHRFYQKVSGNIGQTVAVLDMFISDSTPGLEDFSDAGYREFWFFFSDPYTFDDNGLPTKIQVN